MVKEFHEDTDREYEERVKEVVSRQEPHHSEGAGTVRYFLGDYIFKVAAHENGVFTPEAVERNVKLISDAGIIFPNSTLGVYDLSRHPDFWEGTPVVIQQRADMTFRQSFKNGKATDDTYFMFKRAIDVVDRAVKDDLTLDTSLSNFGLFGNQVALMDIQDANSVNKGIKGEYMDIYRGLLNSLHRYGGNVEKFEEILRKKSKFY